MSEEKQVVGTVAPIQSLPKLEQIKVLYETKQITQTKVLMEIAHQTTDEFFRCDLGLVATITVKDAKRHFPVGEQMFKKWLINQFYILCGDSPSEKSLKEVINTLLANQEYENENYQDVFVRVALHNEKVYIDLGNADYEVVEISKEGWRIIKDAPIKFIRNDTMRSLAIPVKGGEISTLKKVFNMEEQQFRLWLSFIIGCFNPKGPFPILILQGASGSGKTLLSEITKAIVDLAIAPVRSLPKSEQDLFVIAQKNWLLVFDNLSGISNHMSDALCKLSTGGGFATRELYTNNEEAVMAATRPVIVNGIDRITRRQDLANRAIVLSLPYILPKHRKTKEEIWDEYNRNAGSIMGLLCDAVSEALRNFENTEIQQKPRMADFAKWVTATEHTLGFKKGEFLSLYMQNQQEIAEEAVEHDVLVYAIMTAMQTRNRIYGTASQILDLLKSSVEESYAFTVEWVAPNKLKAAITRIEPILLANGIKYNYQRNGMGRIHSFYKIN